METEIIETLPIFFSARGEARYRFIEAYKAWIETLELNHSYAARVKAWEEYVIARDSWEMA